MKRLLIISLFFACVSGFNTDNAISALLKRAPDVVPGTLPEMRDPSYWIGKMSDPDQIILPIDKIKERNAAYIKRMSAPNPYAGVTPGRVPMEWQLNRWPARFIVRPDIGSMNPDELESLVKKQIKACNDYIYSEPYGNYLGVEYSKSDLDKITEESNLANLSKISEIKHGIAVRPTLLRVIPAPFPAIAGIKNIDTSNYTVDLWTSALVAIGTPVDVLFTSKSGSHLFVMGRNQFGWVPSEDIAFGDIKSIQKYSNPKSFLICTADRLPYYTDKQCTIVSGWFGMGAKIPVLSGTDNRRIFVPSRAVNGEFKVEKAWLKPDADVHSGYMPYTRRNIVTLAFKLLGNPYDWTGSAMGRNHETTYRDIFACFGFELPHNGDLFTFFGGKDIAAMPEMGKEKEYSIILDNEPFVSFIACRGHVMLLLGEHDGEPVTFDQSGYSYTDENNAVWHVKRCGIITPGVVSYFFKYPVTFLELK